MSTLLCVYVQPTVLSCPQNAGKEYVIRCSVVLAVLNASAHTDEMQREKRQSKLCFNSRVRRQAVEK